MARDTMSRLLSKIMLALLMLPLAALIYTVVIVTFAHRYSPGWGPDVQAFGVTGLFVWSFIATYWTVLWRRSVNWTSRRIGLTIGASVGVIAPAVIAGVLVSFVDDGFGAFIAGVTAILLWLTATVFIWRETAAERIARIRARGGEAVVCPTCGYNLTGLRQATCPECGSAYTLDELLAAQPAREPADIED